MLVLDRATYHTKATGDTRPPTANWRKAQLIDAIRRCGGSNDDDWPLNWAFEKQFLEHARSLKPTPVYEIQRIANTFTSGDFSINILFLPVAHPELNPIEMVWGKIKRNTASEIMTFRLNDVDEIASGEVAKIDKAFFPKYYVYTLKEEEKYRQLSIAKDSAQ